ncbi:starch synthase 3, chloroplastic/amyloplastic isoform X1 [Iris pallida]|uniref:Starch synthase 3, chloroplastic/amyloplastic isoform X1 n=1 Tax=Iris pallida TaxID=29817 RepID=A0AAX6EMP5_IRIPA|nr:starch synthase 3, chloroplastic/amyloplastic isoform X1 [Iris pallida]
MFTKTTVYLTSWYPWKVDWMNLGLRISCLRRNRGSLKDLLLKELKGKGRLKSNAGERQKRL